MTTPGSSERCPEVRASFFSKLAFSWVDPIIATGNKRTLTEEDVFAIQ
jgi:hypothetical protein